MDPRIFRQWMPLTRVGSVNHTNTVSIPEHQGLVAKAIVHKIGGKEYKVGSPEHKAAKAAQKNTKTVQEEIKKPSKKFKRPQRTALLDSSSDKDGTFEEHTEKMKKKDSKEPKLVLGATKAKSRVLTSDKKKPEIKKTEVKAKEPSKRPSIKDSSGKKSEAVRSGSEVVTAKDWKETAKKLKDVADKKLEGPRPIKASSQKKQEAFDKKPSQAGTGASKVSQFNSRESRSGSSSPSSEEFRAAKQMKELHAASEKHSAWEKKPSQAGTGASGAKPVGKIGAALHALKTKFGSSSAASSLSKPASGTPSLKTDSVGRSKTPSQPKVKFKQSKVSSSPTSVANDAFADRHWDVQKALRMLSELMKAAPRGSRSSFRSQQGIAKPQSPRMGRSAPQMGASAPKMRGMPAPERVDSKTNSVGQLSQPKLTLKTKPPEVTKTKPAEVKPVVTETSEEGKPDKPKVKTPAKQQSSNTTWSNIGSAIGNDTGQGQAGGTVGVRIAPSLVSQKLDYSNASGGTPSVASTHGTSGLGMRNSTSIGRAGSRKSMNASLYIKPGKRTFVGR